MLTSLLFSHLLDKQVQLTYGYGTGNDRMLIKFASDIADIFQFSVIQVAMPTGATSPMTITKTTIGTYDNRTATNRIECLDYDMSSLSSTTCTALFLVWEVTGGGAKAWDTTISR